MLYFIIHGTQKESLAIMIIFSSVCMYSEPVPLQLVKMIKELYKYNIFNIMIKNIS